MTKAAKQLISVLIPVFNHELYVEECIRSIWEQHCEGVEIVAIDDGSSDNSYAVLERLKLESPLPMHIDRQSNQGVVKTFNKALLLSEGSYILCMASDDKLLPGALTIAIDEIRQQGAVTFAMFNAMYFGDVNKSVYLSKTEKLLKSGAANVLRSLYVDYPKPMLLQCTIIDRDFLFGIGGWNPDVALDDWPMFIRLFEYVIRGKATWYFNEAHFLSGYRIHGSNSHGNVVKQIELIKEVIQHYSPAELQAEAYSNLYVDIALHYFQHKNIEGFSFLCKAVKIGSVPLVAKQICNKSYDYLLKLYLTS